VYALSRSNALTAVLLDVCHTAPSWPFPSNLINDNSTAQFLTYLNARNRRVSNVLDTKPYSSEVKLTLSVGGRDLNVAQITDGFLVLRERIAVGQTDARLTISVDGEIQQQDIFLPHGISEDVERIAYL